MKPLIRVIAAAGALICLPHSAEAKGCFKGAMVGGVAGHYAHHHAIAGAMAGCIGGHYLAKRNAQQKPAPAPIRQAH